MSETVKHYDYLIVGAGIMGSAISYILSSQLIEINSKYKIGLIDLDFDGEYSSTLKNAGGVRSTWRNRSNIQLCNYSIQFYEQIGKIIDFKQKGYYWLHNKETWEEINNNLSLYKELDLSVQLVDKEDIKDFLPFIENYEDIYGLSISRKAGIIDHYSLREFYRKEASKNGVEFLNNRYVQNIDIKNSVNILEAQEISDVIRLKSKEVVKSFLKGEINQNHVKIEKYSFNYLINAAGAWSGSISGLYGFEEDEVRPRRRQIELFKCPEIDLRDYGMIIDTSDIYFHQEGENILAGYSNMDEPYVVNFNFDFFSYDEESQFTKYIWIPLVKRNKAFENIKFIRGWSGIYGETEDRSGFIGNVPGFDNIYECVGHTGRGLMISYGAAQALVDLIINNEIRQELWSAKDLNRLRPGGRQYEQLHL